MTAYSSPGTFVNNSTTVPINDTNLNNLAAAVLTAVQADGVGPVISALLKVAAGAGLVNNADSKEYMGFGLDGSSNAGIESTNNPVALFSGQGAFCCYNSKFNGTNDLFLVSGQLAYQLKVGSAGIQWRKSTATGSAGGIITWTAYTTIAS